MLGYLALSDPLSPARAALGPPYSSSAWCPPYRSPLTALATAPASKSAERHWHPFLSPILLFSTQRDVHEATTAPHRLLSTPVPKFTIDGARAEAATTPSRWAPSMAAPPLRFQGASPSPPSPGALGALHRCLRSLEATVAVECRRATPFRRLSGATLLQWAPPSVAKPCRFPVRPRCSPSRHPPFSTAESAFGQGQQCWASDQNNSSLFQFFYFIFQFDFWFKFLDNSFKIWIFIENTIKFIKIQNKFCWIPLEKVYAINLISS
jgi:hypothetical protein